MDESGFKIAVIGLGIIGGSMAYALKGFKNAIISGCDIDAETRRKALESGAVDEVSETPDRAISDADLVVLCVYPGLIEKIISENSRFFKKGAVITDVCGVKTGLYERLGKILPPCTEYVGGHPMAGRETDGFDSATPELFGMCGYLITPICNASEQSIKLVESMARYVGATRISYCTPEEHDSIIAYTSDLMHVSAAALCLDYNEKMNRAYTAGAFRDCTRIANINPELWSGLFIENKDFLLDEIDRFTESISKLRNAIEKEDKKSLKELLAIVRKNKLQMQNKEPENY